MTVEKRRNKAVETNDNAYAIIETQTHKREAKTLRLRELRMAKEAEDAADRLARTPAAGKGTQGRQSQKVNMRIDGVPRRQVRPRRPDR